MLYGTLSFTTAQTQEHKEKPRAATPALVQGMHAHGKASLVAQELHEERPSGARIVQLRIALDVPGYELDVS